MPGYKKTRDVDFKKMQGQAADEAAYQKEYAGRAIKRHTEAYRETGKGTLTAKGKATMTRVENKAKPPKQSRGDAAADLLNQVGNLIRKGKERKRQFDELGNR